MVGFVPSWTSWRFLTSVQDIFVKISDIFCLYCADSSHHSLFIINDNDTGALGVTMNSIWTWMIPICLGWVWIGSQTSHSGIREALRKASQHFVAQGGHD